MKGRRTEQPAENTESQPDWVKTPVADVVRYKPSGIYFARLRIWGKLFRHSLKTDVIGVAKLRLGDFIKDRQEEMGDDSAVRSGRMTVADATSMFRQRLDGQQDVKEGANVYRRKRIEALLKSWPELAKKPAAQEA